MTKNIFRLRLTATLVLVVAAAVSQIKGQGGEIVPPLPEGGGRQIMLQACVQCHDFKVVVSQRKSEFAWRQTVDEMIWRGAPLLPGEVETLIWYLTTSFGPKPSLPRSPRKEESNEKSDRSEPPLAQHLPAGEGRTLVIQACARCHGLREVVIARMTPADWRRNLSQMVKLGATLTASEATVVERYLAKSFGPEQSIPEALQRNPHEKGIPK